jgi:hypothetical protein
VRLADKVLANALENLAGFAAAAIETFHLRAPNDALRRMLESDGSIA